MVFYLWTDYISDIENSLFNIIDRQGRLHHISDGAHAPFEKLGGKQKVKTWGGSNSFDIIYFTRFKLH